jgi:hypothetical protein
VGYSGLELSILQWVGYCEGYWWAIGGLLVGYWWVFLSSILGILIEVAEEEEMELDDNSHPAGPEDRPDDQAIGAQRCFGSVFDQGLDDVNGGEPMSEVLPPMSKDIKYEMLEEPTHIHLALAVSTTEWAQSNTYRNTTYAEILRIYARRAMPDNTDLVPKFGMITSANWEGQSELDLPGRRGSGFIGKLPFGTSSQEQRAPKGWRGVGVFALPKCLRFILRCGCDIVDVDLTLSHVQAFARRHKLPLDSATGKLLLDPTLREQIKDMPWGRRHGEVKSKRLPVAILNAYSVKPADVAPWVIDYQNEVTVHRAKDIENGKEDLKKLKKSKIKKRERPECTLVSRYNDAGEREFMDRMQKNLMTVAKKKPFAFEHDGMPQSKACAEVTKKYCSDNGILIKCKPMPQSIGELKAYMKKEFDVVLSVPNLEPLKLTSLIDDMLAKGLHSLEDPPIDHEAFARAVIDNFDDNNFVLERDDKETPVIQWFDVHKRVWVLSGGARRLWSISCDILRNLAPQVTTGVFGNKDFLQKVVDLVKAKLPHAADLPPLDGDASRYLLRFSDGNVLDFRLGTLRECTPEDRISLSTGYAFQDWRSPLKGYVNGLIEDLNEFWVGGGKSVYGTEFEKRLDKLAMERGTLYWVIYGLFEEHDIALWMIRQLSRGIAATGLIEEFIFLYDSRGINGKGTIIQLLMSALGIQHNNYYIKIDMENLLNCKGGNTPELDTCRGKRQVTVNEPFAALQKNITFNPTKIKQLVNLDDPMSTTGKWKDPNMWKAQCLLLLASNVLPQFPTEDGGCKSRCSFLNMPLTFNTEPKGDTERPLDPTIKVEVVPKLVPEFLFWARILVPAMRLQTLGRILLPRPAKIDADTEAAFSKEATARLDPVDLAKDFCEKYLSVWSKELGVGPSERSEIDEKFEAKYPNRGGKNVTNRLLLSSQGKTRFMQRFDGKTYAVYPGLAVYVDCASDCVFDCVFDCAFIP